MVFMTNGPITAENEGLARTSFFHKTNRFRNFCFFFINLSFFSPSHRPPPIFAQHKFTAYRQATTIFWKIVNSLNINTLTNTRPAQRNAQRTKRSDYTPFGSSEHCLSFFLNPLTPLLCCSAATCPLVLPPSVATHPLFSRQFAPFAFSLS